MLDNLCIVLLFNNRIVEKWNTSLSHHMSYFKRAGSVSVFGIFVGIFFMSVRYSVSVF